jgi:hypothetical protein
MIINCSDIDYGMLNLMILINLRFKKYPFLILCIID